MSNIQFDFNPLTPSPGGGGKIPWGSILIGLGLFAIILATVWYLTKDMEPEDPPLKSLESEEDSSIEPKQID